MNKVEDLDPIKKEASLIERLEDMIEVGRQTIEPSIDNFKNSHAIYLMDGKEKGKQSDKAVKSLIQSHGKLSESLLQSLLKVDGVVVEGFEVARTKRKEAVKYFQGLLDVIDGLKDTL